MWVFFHGRCLGFDVFTPTTTTTDVAAQERAYVEKDLRLALTNRKDVLNELYSELVAGEPVLEGSESYEKLFGQASEPKKSFFHRRFRP